MVQKLSSLVNAVAFLSQQKLIIKSITVFGLPTLNLHIRSYVHMYMVIPTLQRSWILLSPHSLIVYTYVCIYISMSACNCVLQVSACICLLTYMSYLVAYNEG